MNDDAVELDAIIKEEVRQGRMNSWRMCEAIYWFDQMEGWSVLGMHQTAWLDQPDVGLTRSEFFRSRKRHRVLVVEGGLTYDDVADIAVSKLDIVVPAIEDRRVSLEMALHACRRMNCRELRKAYRLSPDLVADAAKRIANAAEGEYMTLEALRAVADILTDESLPLSQRVRQALMVCQMFEDGGEEEQATG